MIEAKQHNKEMNLAWQYIEGTHVSVFLTGKAGTGKTTFLKKIRELSPKRMVVVAPTGVAAINAQGVTIHSFFQLSIGVHLPGMQRPEGRSYYQFSKEKKNILRTLDLLVIDEINNIGWFASDRYQPSGYVCIYTFIPNASRHPVDFENAAPATIHQWATLLPIRSTWTAENEAQRISARQHLSLQSVNNSQAKKREFELVINDIYTYTNLSDFRNPQAKELCKEWIQKKKNFDTLSDQLETLRTTFANSNRTKQNNMRQQILDLEKSVEQIDLEISQTEKKIRAAELQ